MSFFVVASKTKDVIMGKGENGQAVRGEGEVGRESGQREREENIQTAKEEDGQATREDDSEFGREESVKMEGERGEQTEEEREGVVSEEKVQTVREELEREGGVQTEREGNVPEESGVREEKPVQMEREEINETRRESEKELDDHEPKTTTTWAEPQTEEASAEDVKSDEKGIKSLLMNGKAATPASNEIQVEEHEEESAPVINSRSTEEAGASENHAQQEVAIVNGEVVKEEEVGEKEKKRWSFPPEFEDFDLVESDVDPAELEQIFADNR